MRISAVNRYLGAPTIECTGQPVQGRSGGGLFNESAQLIGVCSAADPAERKGIYAGLAAVHSLLDRQGLASLYQSRAGSDPRLANRANQARRKTPLTVPPPDQLGLQVGSGFTL